jgi:hypothetical protein
MAYQIGAVYVSNSLSSPCLTRRFIPDDKRLADGRGVKVNEEQVRHGKAPVNRVPPPKKAKSLSPPSLMSMSSQTP